MKTAMMKLVSGVFLVTTILNPVWAWEPLALYDNFNSFLINPDKWFGRISQAGTGLQVTEEARLILLGNMHLLSRAYANPTTDSGGSFHNQGVGFINPEPITAIKTSIRIIAQELKACGSNDQTSRVRARFAGYFFNITNAPTLGSAVNDVFASIGLRRLASMTDPYTLSVDAGIDLCLNPSCTETQVLCFTNLGTTRLGNKVILRLEWDVNKNQFIVQRDNQPEVYMPYDVPVGSFVPGVQSKRLEIGHFLSNCTVEPQPTSFMSAFFDDVYVNESALNALQ